MCQTLEKPACGKRKRKSMQRIEIIGEGGPIVSIIQESVESSSFQSSQKPEVAHGVWVRTY